MVLNQTFAPNSLRQDLNRLFYAAPISQPSFASHLWAQSHGFYAPQPFYGSDWRTSVLPTGIMHGQFQPKANWAETPEASVLTIELPGVELSQVSLRIEGTHLILEGVRHPGGLLGDRMVNYHMAEGRFGAFRWACPIPQAVMVGGIEASFRNGLLTIILPRTTAPIGMPNLAGASVMAAAPSAQVAITPASV